MGRFTFVIPLLIRSTEARERYPVVRFVPYGDLSSDALLDANTLGYSESSWNNVGDASIEGRSFDELSLLQQGAIRSLKINRYTWDCFLNHFSSYSWEELADAGVQGSIVNLGWTEDSWVGIGASPPSENTAWSDLRSDERAAAEDLCFFEQLWDRVPLTDWEVNIRMDADRRAQDEETEEPEEMPPTDSPVEEEDEPEDTFEPTESPVKEEDEDLEDTPEPTPAVKATPPPTREPETPRPTLNTTDEPTESPVDPDPGPTPRTDDERPKPSPTRGPGEAPAPRPEPSPERPTPPSPTESPIKAPVSNPRPAPAREPPTPESTNQSPVAAPDQPAPVPNPSPAAIQDQPTPASSTQSPFIGPAPDPGPAIVESSPSPTSTQSSIRSLAPNSVSSSPPPTQTSSYGVPVVSGKPVPTESPLARATFNESEMNQNTNETTTGDPAAGTIPDDTMAGSAESEDNSSRTIWIVVGSAVAGGAVVFALGLLVTNRINKRREAETNKEEHIEVSVDRDDDISTLGVPTVFGGSTAVSGSAVDEKTASIGIGYDFLKSAGMLGSVGADTTMPESFEVEAPPGKLGIVINTPGGGLPVVQQMKPDSVLCNRVQLGDQLIAVDDVDVTTMTAVKVSKLISSKSDQERLLVFVRPLERSVSSEPGLDQGAC